MKLSDYKNEDALDLLADILEPVSEIMTDKKFKEIVLQKTPRIEIVRYLLKNQNKNIIKALARIENVPVEKYNKNILEMTKSLLEILNDKELVDFFTSQGRTMVNECSGSATENTEEIDEA